MKKTWVLGIWIVVPWLCGELLERREVNIFLRIKLCHFKIISSTFFRWLYSCSVGLNSNKNLIFLGFIDYIIDKSLRV